MRNRIAWHRLCNEHKSTVPLGSEYTHMKPARNSRYCVYVVHCQKENGREEAPIASGLDRGRYLMQMYSRASWMRISACILL